MLTLYLRRNLSETAVPRNLVLRQWPDDGTRTETTTGRIFWRYEDEVDMVPQFLATGVAGFETAVPFDSRGRNIRLYFIGRTELDTPNAQSFAEAEQKVVDMSGTTDVESLFEHFTDKPTEGTGEETLWIDQIDAGKLAVHGDKATGEYVVLVGVHNSGESDQLRLRFAGTVIFDTGGFTENLGTGRIEFTIMRRSNTAVRCDVYFASLTAWEPVYTEITGLDLDATDYDIELLGTSADAAGDVIGKMGYGRFEPASTTNTGWWLDENGEPWQDEDGDQYED